MTRYYKDELVTLYNGDCMDEMRSLHSIDKIITSPPYNITRHAVDQGYDEYRDGMDNKDYLRWTKEIFMEYDRILNPNGCVLYNMSYGAENTEVMSLTVAEIIRETPFTLADILVWKKKTATPNNMSANKMTRICEYVYVFCRKTEFHTFTTNKKVLYARKDNGQAIYENVFNYFVADNNDECQWLNKATFSQQFVQELIDRYVLPTDVVLDNFSGTGTTLVACVANGIKAIGIELSEAQCEYAKKRLQKGVQTQLAI